MASSTNGHDDAVTRHCRMRPVCAVGHVFLRCDLPRERAELDRCRHAAGGLWAAITCVGEDGHEAAYECCAE